MCCSDLDIPNVDGETACVCSSEEFDNICLYKPYLEIILVGLSRIRGDYLERPTSNRSYQFAVIYNRPNF